MPDYRRYFVSGATYFFTVVAWQRRPILANSLGRRCLRSAFETVRESHPFELIAVVLLPDHLLALWSLPRNSSDYSLRWRRIKEEFTRGYLEEGGREAPVGASRALRKERGVWQRRFWEHLIKDEFDLERHLDYIHYNPVKHGLVRTPVDWPWSSFHRYVSNGAYPADWGRLDAGPMPFDDLKHTTGE
jgi:putative transposase